MLMKGPLMTQSHTTALRRSGGLAVFAGSLFAAVGIGAWAVITKQLRDEKITVPGNAPVLADRPVAGPATAYAEALAIKANAERAAGGRTFAEISDALRTVEKGSDEAEALHRQSSALSTAAALRTSLMTSVLAYGVSVFAAGLGVLLMAVGSLLRRSGGR